MIVEQIDYRGVVNELDSHWVSHISSFVPQLS